MADPLFCLRGVSIAIAIWNIIYSLIQMGILGWQISTVKGLQWEYENRQLPATGAIDGFQARFPGLYSIYTETPERRRINAMYVIVLIDIFLAFVHFFMSIVLLYGCIKYKKNFIWPWFFSAGPIIIMSTAYAVLWWSGDVFNEQLTMSVAEFVMSLGINGICLIIVLFFYWRLTGQLTSDKPAEIHEHVRPPTRYEMAHQSYAPIPAQPGRRSGRQSAPPAVPAWRTEWPTVPDIQLQRKIKRRSRSPRRRVPEEVQRLDFYAPQPYDSGFPWKMEKLRKPEPKPKTQREAIKELYYITNPEEMPDVPRQMRSSMRKQRAARGKSPDRVTWSRNEPSIHYRTPSDLTPQERNSVV
ncbi:unnamed protein product [Auanema sp. JU1783]|nr:unnamed protein product [Auanema sp. JU1783]